MCTNKKGSYSMMNFWINIFCRKNLPGHLLLVNGFQINELNRTIVPIFKQHLGFHMINK